MSDSVNGTVIHDRPPEADDRPAVDASLNSRADGRLAVGQRWRDYVMEAPWPIGGAGAFLADHVGHMEKVIVRACPIVDATEWRRGAWERLCAMPEAPIVKCVLAEEESGWRYEVSALPPPMTLREWMTCHRPTFEEIEALVRQLATTLGVLHAQGVVHLNIRPDIIHIDESSEAPVYILGGLQEATLYTQPDLMPSDVDPFYAPPEAAGLVRHLPGTRLCAWDWWSMGRVVQEFLIGRHVLGVVLDRDVSKVTPELRSRAELLLLEREPAGARAGALEYMQLEPSVAPILRGLLTGSTEARWGSDAVQRWLRHEPVQDHYELPRNARLWVFRGRGFTLAEAAEYFTSAENWDEGEEMLFNGERPESLAVFLKESPAHKADLERLQAVCDLSETTAWGDVPVIARRTVTAALAWLSLANGSGVRTALRIRGQSVDALGLAELLRAAGASTGVAIFTAMLTPSVVGFVESYDAPAARVLNAVAAKGLETLRHGEQNGWLDPHDDAGRARILELALKAGALLRERIDLLRSVYGTNSNPSLATVLAAKTPTPRDVVILAFTGEAPERFGYITHEQSRRQQVAALKVQVDAVMTAQFWIQLERLLATTRIWGASSNWYAGVALALAVVTGGLSRSVSSGAMVAAVLLSSRLYFCHRVRTMARKFDPTAKRWEWHDGFDRAESEAKTASARHKMNPAELSRELTRLQRAMNELAKAPATRTTAAGAQWWDLWLMLAASVLLTISIFAPLVKIPHGSGEQRIERPARTSAGNVLAPENSKANETPALKKDPAHAAMDVAALIASGRYELVDDGFGQQLRGPLKPWTFYATADIKTTHVIERAPATPDQSAFALVCGTLLLQPYSRRAANVLLAIRVPTTRGFGILVFNTRDRKLVDHEVLLLQEPLQEHAWYQLGRYRIGYLGTPAVLESEISLAPP